MTDVALNNITSGYNTSKINDNFLIIKTALNVDRLQTHGGGNTMYQDLDLNGFSLLNASIDPTNPGSLLTVAAGDARYYNVSGDTLTGPMNVNNQTIVGLKLPIANSSPVRKDQLEAEALARTLADISLQEQILGINPPMGSAFSPISWHDQVISSSIAIPANKNAWSFGPTMTVAPGQTVTIGTNSFWTIANGESS